MSLESELKPEENKSEREISNETEKEPENEFAYIDRPGFTSEIFKIEIRGLPKFYGMGELRKLINTKLNLNSCKIKWVKPGSPWAYVCFRNQEEREIARKTLNGYVWKGKTLQATEAKPAPDPLVKRRNEQGDGDGVVKKRKTLEESTTALSYLSYEDQLKQKQSEIENILKKLGNDMWRANHELREHIEEQRTKFNGLPCELHPIKSSPLVNGYRNKCEFSIGKDLHGETVVGFRLGSYANGFTEVGEVQELKHIPDKMKLAVKLFQDFVRRSNLDVYNPENQTGYFRQLTARTSEINDEIMLLVGINPQNLSDEKIKEFQTQIVKFFTEEEGKELNVTSLYYQEIKKRDQNQITNPVQHLHGTTHITDIIHGLKFRISPEAFFQINTPGANILYQTAIDLGAPTLNTSVLDICCGTGTIGLCFAKHCKQVLGVEIIEQAVADADFNAKNNEITNCKFFTGSAEDLIFSLMKQTDVGTSDVLAIVDPPRAGLHVKSIQHLRNARGLNRLVYISCFPQLAAKNWVDLIKPCSKTMKGNPFVLKKAVSVDMFPHTPHTELVLLFERSGIGKAESELINT